MDSEARAHVVDGQKHAGGMFLGRGPELCSIFQTSVRPIACDGHMRLPLANFPVPMRSPGVDMHDALRREQAPALRISESKRRAAVSILHVCL